MYYKVSEDLKAAVRRFEGLRLTAYRDTGGVLTIGYGHTSGVKEGQRITRSAAETMLRADLVRAMLQVGDLHAARSQGEADALCDFVFNLGAGNLRSSTLLKEIRKPKRDEAAIRREFLRWIYSGGRPQAGLKARRSWEASRFFEK